jgi:uncharacterized OB-fold protein
VEALRIQVCTACGRAAFPPRLACPRCHESEWHLEAALVGTIEHVTAVRRSAVLADDELPVWLALVRTDLGPQVIARLDGAASAGQRVELAADGNAVRARASGAGSG